MNNQNINASNTNIPVATNAQSMNTAKIVEVDSSAIAEKNYIRPKIEEVRSTPPIRTACKIEVID
jgi:hypothetical protein